MLLKAMTGKRLEIPATDTIGLRALALILLP